MKSKFFQCEQWDGEEELDRPTLFMTLPPANGDSSARAKAQDEHIARLERIIASLIQRVERSMDHHANAYSLFQTAIVLDEEVRARTAELRRALRDLEQMNCKLKAAKDVAERLNASKTKFLAAAGHDLLQPLNAARLSLSALKEEKVSQEAAALIAQVDRSLTSVEQLMRMLMDISKLDAGVTQPEICKFPINHILQGLYWDFAPEAKRRGLKLRMIGTLAAVSSDPVFLRRILQNLLSNAIRYTRTGGVCVFCHKQDQEVRISVIDTGIGISVEEKDQIFEEFHRGRAPDGHHAEGLGLGLAIAKRMAEALDHKLFLHSELGRGTVFSVSVPLAGTKPTPCEKSLDRGRFVLAHEGAFVVVIENDEAARTAMEKLLSRWSCQTVSAESIGGILCALDEIERTPDLIIADYYLNNGEFGLDAIKAVCTKFAQRIPALVVTADHAASTAMRIASAGYALLTKPVQPAELRALMSHLLMSAAPGGIRSDPAAPNSPR